MANSRLLKEAIADAKAVRETAIANAKIALEEAFTPRLQSILSKKLTAEMEGEDEETMEEGDHSNEEEVEDEVAVEETVEVTTEAEEVESDEDSIEEGEGSIEDPTNADDATISEEEEIESEDEIDKGRLFCYGKFDVKFFLKSYIHNHIFKVKVLLTGRACTHNSGFYSRTSTACEE